MPTDTYIQIDRLGKRYNRQWIFKDFTFKFEFGKTYAITGPNGSGKSTLMQVLWGQIPASKGQINYACEGKIIDINNLHEYVAIAAPYLDLPESLTLTELLNFHFKFKKIRNGNSIKDLLEIMELSHAKHKVIEQFSSGMKQRLKLALCMLSEGSFVFLDEPGTNLDDSALLWYIGLLGKISPNLVCFIASNDKRDFINGCDEISLEKLKAR